MKLGRYKEASAYLTTTTCYNSLIFDTLIDTGDTQYHMALMKNPGWVCLLAWPVVWRMPKQWMLRWEWKKVYHLLQPGSQVQT